MAKDGNSTAQTVIGISNEMNVQAVGEVQKKMDNFNTESFASFKENVSRNKASSFFLMNLKSLANLGHSQSKDEIAPRMSIFKSACTNNKYHIPKSNNLPENSRGVYDKMGGNASKPIIGRHNSDILKIPKHLINFYNS